MTGGGGALYMLVRILGAAGGGAEHRAPGLCMGKAGTVLASLGVSCERRPCCMDLWVEMDLLDDEKGRSETREGELRDSFSPKL